MRVLATLIAVVVVGSASPRAQDLALRATLARAADYVGRFADQIAGMIVEERYDQEAKQVARFGYRPEPHAAPDRIAATSSQICCWCVPTGLDAWMQFRDVYEVDGRKVRDRTDRLEKLFINTDRRSSGRRRSSPNASSGRARATTSATSSARSTFRFSG